MYTSYRKTRTEKARKRAHTEEERKKARLSALYRRLLNKYRVYLFFSLRVIFETMRLYGVRNQNFYTVESNAQFYVNVSPSQCR